MAGGYKAPQTGFDALAARIARIEQALAATRAAAGLESAVVGSGGVTLRDGGRISMYDVDENFVGLMYPGGIELLNPATGGAMALARGIVQLWDNYADNPTNFGRIATDQNGSHNLRLFPPFSSGNGLENSVTIQGRRAGSPGGLWLYTDGQMLLDADGTMFLQASGMQASADSASITAGVLNLSASQLGLFNIPSTTAAANLRLGTIGGVWTIGFISSSRRSKVDIEDLEIDPREVLRLRPRTWRDRTDVEADPTITHRTVGFIAEEVDEVEDLRPFVEYDEDADPSGVTYDRIAAGLVVLAQHQEKRIVELETTVAAQADQLAALTARLDALEADRA